MSLLPLAGMFILGGKKKEEEDIKEKYRRLLEEASKKYGIPKEIISSVRLFAIHNGGQVRILQKALGIPEKKLFEILDAIYTIPLKHIYISSHRGKKWYEEIQDPYSGHLAQIHPILAVAAAEHTKTYTQEVGHAVGDALNRIYKDGIYLELKKDPVPLIDAIYEELTERGVPIADTEKFYKRYGKGIQGGVKDRR